MVRIFISGLALFVAAAVAIALDALLGLGLGFAILGIAIGGILGLVSDGSPIGRMLAYIIGVVIVIAAYLGRVLVGNSSELGLLVGSAVIIFAITLMAGLSNNWLPLWAGLLGAVTVIGAYETAFEIAPQNILSELLPQVSTALVPVALAFLATVWFSVSGSAESQPQSEQPREPEPEPEPGDGESWTPWQEQREVSS
jgi:hypothetical protein